MWFYVIFFVKCLLLQNTQQCQFGQPAWSQHKETVHYKLVNGHQSLLFSSKFKLIHNLFAKVMGIRNQKIRVWKSNVNFAVL